MFIESKLTALLAVALVGLLFLFTPKAEAQPCCEHPPELPRAYEGTWYTLPIASKHLNTSKHHNERNWGFGIEKHFWGRNWQMGSYKNSQYRNSSFIMTELTSYRFSDTLRLRFNAGLITGYQYPVTPIILPVWTYETRTWGVRWGIDFLTIPPIGKRMGILALQVKLKF
jgi:hypothetical protein